MLDPVTFSRGISAQGPKFVVVGGTETAVCTHSPTCPVSSYRHTQAVYIPTATLFIPLPDSTDKGESVGIAAGLSVVGACVMLIVKMRGRDVCHLAIPYTRYMIVSKDDTIPYLQPQRKKERRHFFGCNFLQTEVIPF
jgi:hypothetical protein